MKINLVLLALLIAVVSVVSGHNSIKARFFNRVGDFKDAIKGLKKATIAAVKKKKGIEVETEPEWDEKMGPEKIAPPTTKCHTVFDDVWQEECGTKFNNTCRLETKPVCTTIRAKECTPEPQESCTWVMENKCKTISVPSCSVDWEKRCTKDPICTTVQKKVCGNVEKDVCVEHLDKVCTTTTVKVCRKVAIQEKIEDWPTTKEDWPTTKAKGEGGLLAQKANFKNAALDQIEAITDAGIDQLKAKVMAKIVKRDVAALANFKNAALDQIEAITDTGIDQLEAKVMAKIVKRDVAALAEKKAAIKAAKAKFKASLFGDKAKEHVAPTLKVKFVKKCEDEPRQTCKKLPRNVCHKETVPVCHHEPKESCVEKETCKSWPKKNCEMVHKETCWPFPTKKCTEITTNVCKNVDRQKCVDKTHEICEAIPIKDCKKKTVKKPRQVCIPLPTIRTKEDW